MIHMDFYRPVNVISTSKCEYALVMISEYSLYTWLPTVTGDVNVCGDSDPSSGNGSISKELSSLTKPLSEDRDLQKIPETA